MRVGPEPFHLTYCTSIHAGRDLGAFVNTQAYLRELPAMLRAGSPSRHLEVETYTWDVLPEEYRHEDFVSDVARELNWVRDRLVP